VYADINGLTMFYEIRGASVPGKVPVVLLHGAISATGTSSGPLPDLLCQASYTSGSPAAPTAPSQRIRAANATRACAALGLTA
jgi:hypothetical protein